LTNCDQRRPNTGRHAANDAAGELKISKVAMVRRKQVYKITYPNGKIYVGMDLTGSLLYLGSPSAAQQIAEDLDLDDHRFDLTLRKAILWESQTATDAEVRAMEVKLIRETGANNPAIGYNRSPHYRAT
jgi:hypothetical protein